jgi:hypothetical protein
LYIKPWSKETENILKQLTRDGRACTTDTKSLPIQFGQHCKEIINKDMLDIATIRNKSKKKTWFITPPNIFIVPRNSKRGIRYHFKYKI